MKRKLFVIALLVSCYSVFTLAFTTLDSQEKISTLVSEVGLSDATALDSSADLWQDNLRTPCPKPDRPKPKPKPRLGLN